MHASHTLLHAVIVANAERQYAVTFTPANGAPIAEHEYLRFALHYYARVLYEMVQRSRTVHDLPVMIDKLTSGGIGWHGDVFAIAGIR